MTAVRPGLLFLLLCGLSGCLLVAKPPPECIDADCSGGYKCEDTGGFCLSDCYGDGDCQSGYHCDDDDYECRADRGSR